MWTARRLFYAKRLGNLIHITYIFFIFRVVVYEHFLMHKPIQFESFLKRSWYIDETLTGITIRGQSGCVIMGMKDYSTVSWSPELFWLVVRILVINWITMTRKSGKHCVRHTEALNSCFDLIWSHQQCLPFCCTFIHLSNYFLVWNFFVFIDFLYFWSFFLSFFPLFLLPLSYCILFLSISFNFSLYDSLIFLSYI